VLKIALILGNSNFPICEVGVGVADNTGEFDSA
jgi:hypothetical protein